MIQATEIQMSACKILKQALKNRGNFLSRCECVQLFAFMNIQVVHENINLVAVFLRKYKYTRCQQKHNFDLKS